MPTPKLHFSRAEFDQRIAKTRAAMQAHGLDLLIVSDPSNMNWLTAMISKTKQQKYEFKTNQHELNLIKHESKLMPINEHESK